MLKDILTEKMSECKQAIAVFLEKTGEITSQEETSETIVTVLRFVEESMRELSMSIFVAYLADIEPKENMVIREETQYYFKEVRTKEFLMKSGKTTIARRIYEDEQGNTYVPLDAYMRLEGEYADLPVREMIAYLAGSNTPSEIEEIFRRFMSCHPSRDFIQRTAQKIGQYIEENHDKIQEDALEVQILPRETKVISVSLDGANVPLREEGPKHGRPKERPGTENDPNIKSSWKNAMVATVSFYGEVPKGEQTPKRLKTTYLARMPEERFPAIRQELEKELESVLPRLPEGTRKVIVIDGAKGLSGYFHSTAFFKGWTEILDFHHACEHLSLLGEALFGKSNEQGQQWYKKYRIRLLTSRTGVDEILRSVSYYSTKEGCKIPKMREKDLVTQRGYFVRNRHRMNYACWRAEGLPIGSGPVEAACKSVVKARLCGSGMRWNRKNGQNILNIRTMIKSHRWDSAWNYYVTHSAS